MTLALELGQVSDPSARRALEQISLRWPSGVPVVSVLPAIGSEGQIVYLIGDRSLYIWSGGQWNKVGGVPVVSSLPSSPTDGQEVFVLASDTKGVMWRFRYRAASTHPYKWEFVGGPALTSFVTPGVVTGGVWTSVPSSRLVMPFLGEYRLQINGNAYSPDSGARGHFLGTEVEGSGFAASQDSGPSSGFGVQITLDLPWGIGAGKYVGLAVNSANGAFRNCSLAVTPIRIT